MADIQPERANTEALILSNAMLACPHLVKGYRPHDGLNLRSELAPDELFDIFVRTTLPEYNQERPGFQAMLIPKRHAIELGALHAIVMLGSVEDTVDGCLHSLLRAICEGVARAVARLDSIVERTIDSGSPKAPRGRKRARSTSTPLSLGTTKVDGREAADDGETEHPSVRIVDRKAQTHASDSDKGVKIASGDLAYEPTFEEGLAYRDHTNIIYLLTGKFPTSDIHGVGRSQELDNDVGTAEVRSGEAAPSQSVHREALLAAPKTSPESVCPDATSIAVLGAGNAGISILPLTAENLAKIPDVERLKTPREKETDEVIDKLKGLQHQMKSMMVSLKEQRLHELQLQDEAEENGFVSCPRNTL